MITEDYVSFETAKLLKEKGYKGSFDGYYNDAGYVVNRSNFFLKEPEYQYYERVSLQMAMKWLRKEHQIGIFPRQYHIYKDNAVSDEFGYGVEIIKLGTDIPLNPNEEKISDKDRYFISTSYEQACEAAIKYSLENLI